MKGMLDVTSADLSGVYKEVAETVGVDMIMNFLRQWDLLVRIT